MAKLVFALNQSLDGYVDHTAFVPDPVQKELRTFPTSPGTLKAISDGLQCARRMRRILADRHAICVKLP